MKGRPPHRGSGAKRGPGGFAPRAGTGPRTSAKEAAQRAARNRGEDAGERSPWDDGAAIEAAPRPKRPPRAAAPKADAPRTGAKAAVARAPRAESPPPAAGPTRREQRAAASATLASGVQTLTVAPDEAGMRIDRFLGARFPQLPFTRVQSIVRKGELRVDGKRAKPNDRLEPGSSVRVPPLKLEQPTDRPRSAAKVVGDAEFLRSLILYEDADMMILNKPFGLAVQGGSGTVRHVDGLLEALTGPDGQRPRLVHRLDKDTAGCLIVAKTRLAAATLAKSFRSRAARKIYWALVAGVPRTRQGRVSTYLVKDEPTDADARMRVAKHGDEGASHALTYYATVDQAAQKLAWLSLKPVTGRTHQLRAHAAHIGHPIVGDPKYFDVENWELPGGIQNRLHLLARRIVIPHPRTGQPVDVSAPLPPHMAQSWNLLGFDAARYDPIVEAPEA
ncbi:pseudouridine synthase, RluA family [Methylorubrum populi BJ001]|jgi:23S rRNA pseudouridine955/2504/2580 synthase|uniref:Ribosomal large subunit pseudouridine synthase D n=1 Tax=Methylorubrum populi (strain ATCC BAA-705 / NCIMB 13946 / BJ001) TaxID=441620 RepID=B1ZI46_METPB|nr:RluA family pseudouridine synthase [Methylorubrum populi]ACB78532.1 pseudouridine synthase, RluA family [Methylorubrum populi BJ001]OAH35109.1 pseudouridine synthase [Methylorubrum populi]PZP69835.1 MAG: RluA family pseudouridine synthase [Methylorubrum populi]